MRNKYIVTIVLFAAILYLFLQQGWFRTHHLVAMQ